MTFPLDSKLIVLVYFADTVLIHVSPHTAMNGATNFLLYDSPLSSTSSSAWYISPSPSLKSPSPKIAYSKSESPTLDLPSAFANSPESFDFLLVDATEARYPEKWTSDGEWKVVEEVKGFAGFGKFWRKEKFGPKEKKSVGILERVR